MPTPKSVTECCLSPDEAAQFYRDVLGVPITKRQLCDQAAQQRIDHYKLNNRVIWFSQKGLMEHKRKRMFEKKEASTQ